MSAIIRSDNPVAHNVAQYLRNHAQVYPEKLALVAPKTFGAIKSEVAINSYQHFSFLEIERLSNTFASGLTNYRIGQGTRVLLMVPPGLEFVCLWFALLKLGAVTILIDPGMGRNNLFQCIEEVSPEAVISIPIVRMLAALVKKPFRSVKTWISPGATFGLFHAGRKKLISNANLDFPLRVVKPDDAAAVVFTTGSTGVPKGVLYRHHMFRAQLDLIKSHFEIGSSDIGLPAFLPFSLFCIAMGTTTIMPKMNPRKPAKADPAAMLELIRNYHVTYSFGSPAFWQPVSAYAVANKIALPSLKKVMMFGAPVREEVLSALRKVLPPEGNSFTPYGATEALPITSISGSDILSETQSLSRQGFGVCVGKPLNGTNVRIIKISDEIISTWSEQLEVARESSGSSDLGEIVVSGAMVTEEYFNRPEQTNLAKINGDKTVWHRMGDLGYFDSKGRLWFCGRKNHRVITDGLTLHTIPCEALFNQHPLVRRSALVGIGPSGKQRPVICIELKNSKHSQLEKNQIRLDLFEIASEHEITKPIKDLLFHHNFPVDFRHNAKIIREALAVWAAKELGVKMGVNN